MRNSIELPAGVAIADVLPAFAGIKYEIRVGKPNQECACCRRPFDLAVMPRKVLRMYYQLAAMPLVLELRVCGRCYKFYRRGGQASVMAAVEAYVEGAEFDQ